MKVEYHKDRFLNKLNRYLSLQIISAIILGILFGLYFPSNAIQMQWVATLFVTIIRLFVPPIIFLTAITLFGGLEDLKSVGRITIKAILYFAAISITAISFGIGSALLIRPGKVDRKLFVDAIPNSLLENNHAEWVNLLIQNGMLILLVVAIGMGLMINQSQRWHGTLHFLEKMRSAVMVTIRYVFVLAPLVTFSGIAYAVGRYGMDTLLPIGKMLAGTYLAMALFIFFILGSILFLLKVNIIRFLGQIKNELLYALGTSSSSSVIPLLMERLEAMGLKPSAVRLVTVTGNSLNLNGTCIYLGMAVIFLAQLYEVTFSISELLGIVMIILLTSKGATGIPGTGFLALVTTISSIHRLPVEGLAILLSIDRFMSEARAITNTVGHGVAALIISREHHTQINITNLKKEHY